MLIANLRAREFARLDEADHAYLDYTGAALYPQCLVDVHADMLRHAVLGNPHSENGASLASSALAFEARARVRHFFNAEDYDVCFTHNASGAIRLVAEGFPFNPGSTLLLAADNHNSVNGIREYALRSGATVRHLDIDGELRLRRADLGTGPGLFAYPAQSNFSGVKHSLDLVAAAQRAGYSVLLDAAAFAPTNRLDLGAVRPEFVAVSLYKIFGYPTGVGALLARRGALAQLRRPWFAGGTVEYVTVRGMSYELRNGAEGFEDGTVNFLSLGAISEGLRWMENIGVTRVGAHAGALAARLSGGLRALRHRNGSPMVVFYGPLDRSEQGAVVTFNVLDERGAVIPHLQVETLARDVRVSVRGGCFCNPGAAEGAGIGRGARVEGAVRASLGIANDARDVSRLLDVVDAAATRSRPIRQPHPAAAHSLRSSSHPAVLAAGLRR